MKVVIIDYQAGNTQSVAFALDRLGIESNLTGNHDEIRSADKVIFPGVGEASSTMDFLKEKQLDVLIKELRQPVLGICLGMQLMCARSEEGDAKCLGIFPLEVKKFQAEADVKVPHMGWNRLEKTEGWLNDLPQNSFAYFVHSFYVPLSEYTSAVTNYALNFSSAIQKDNFYAVQFHPEKSAETGVNILKSFFTI